MAIKKGDIIKVEYEGRLEDGTIFDSTELNEGVPLKFEVGAGNIIPGFDNAVIGKEVNEEFEISLKPNEAYGEIDPILTQIVARDQIPEDLNEDIEPGMMLRVSDPNGNYSVAWIRDVDDEFVTIDLNHPLAGKILNFKIKILETGCEPDPPDMCGCGCGHDHH
ncbi:MAG: peptidylprolyl isomerase [Candidatus Hodarchaeota archaeon]